MTKYIITTESGSDLPKELIDRYNIHIVPMHVTMADQTFPDGSFPVEDIYSYYDKTQTLPKTSGSTPQDNTEVFEKIVAQYPDAHIIHIAYSAVTTVSYNAATIAAKEFDNIHLVDSKNVSLGLAAIVKAAAEFIEANPETTPEKIIAFVEDVRERTRFIFLPNTLLYLKAGGRVSNLAFHGANLLNLHPTIILDNGYLVSGKKFRGSYERCIKKMIDHFFNNHDIDLDTVLLGGSPGLTDDHKEVAYKLIQEYDAPVSDWVATGAVISSHGGPGAMGIVGIEKPRS